MVINRADGVLLRSAQVFGVAASSLTIRYRAEHSLVQDAVIARDRFPGGILGDPCFVVVSGTSPAYTISSIGPAGFWHHGSNTSVSQGRFDPGEVPMAFRDEKSQPNGRGGTLKAPVYL